MTIKGTAAGLADEAAQKAARLPAMAVSFNAGGAFNTMSQISQGNVNNPYELAQSWVGGGLSGVVGTGYLLKSKAKFGGKFLSYAGQSAMYDFAYTKQEDFAKRNFGDFVALYGIGGVMGASVGSLKGMEIGGRLNTNFGNKIVKTTFNSVFYLTELRMTSQLKGKPGKPKPQPNKGSVLGAKLFFNYFSF